MAWTNPRLTQLEFVIACSDSTDRMEVNDAKYFNASLKQPRRICPIGIGTCIGLYVYIVDPHCKVYLANSMRLDIRFDMISSFSVVFRQGGRDDRHDGRQPPQTDDGQTQPPAGG